MTAAPPQTPRPVRRDIQGLRAVAVTLVVVYHLVPEALPGGFVGVDVFFVVSGFLITAHLIDRPPRRAGDFAAFWARRIRRLLPASLLVVVATLVASRLVAPSTEWARNAREAVASTFYVENWALARSATDYLAVDTASSPFQHFWSLGVEEQFYLLWPLLVGGVWWLGRRTGRPRRLLAIAVAVVLAASFAASVVWTAVDPAAAYFVTPTRLWELAAGGALAVVLPRLRLSDRARPVVAWAGLGAIVGSAFVLSGSDPFPGWRAVVPVLGAVVFLAAAAEGRRSPTGALGVRPVQWLGDVSYSVYLWHWPLVTLAPYALDRDLRALDLVGVALLTLALSALSYRHVEQRWRRAPVGSRARRPFVAALAASLVVAAMAGAQGVEVDVRADQARERAAEALRTQQACLGAAALAQAERCAGVDDSDLVISPEFAASDRAPVFANRCFETPPYRETPSCTSGTGTLKVALVGNSHSAHWWPALRGVRDVEVTTYLASECTTVEGVLLEFDTRRKAEGCRDWAERVRAATSGDRFDLVVTSQRNVHAVVGHAGADRDVTLRAAYQRFLETWTATGTRVLVVKDTPFPDDDIGPVPTCVAEHLDDLAACSGDPVDWIPRDPLAEAARAVEGTRVVDLNRYICARSACRPVNGRVITYFDGSHLSETYARTLTPYLEAAIDEAVGR